jgi:hypothetical protein
LERHEVRAEEEVTPRAALVIAACRPSELLPQLIESLGADRFAAVVVVDDGSGPEYAGVFALVRALGAAVIKHAVRAGRGAAVRAGMHRALEEAGELDAIVLAEERDTAEEIARLARHSAALAIGRPVGIRGEGAMRILAGVKVSDPWATLRSIPASLIPHLLTLESRGAEFDIEALVIAAEHGVAIVEEPLEREDRAARGALWPLLRFFALERPEHAMTRWAAALSLAILVGAVGAGVYGFATGHLFQQFIWLPWGERRFFHFAALFAAFSAAVLMMFPWAYAALFAALLFAGTALASGPLALGAALLFLLASNTLGRALIGRLPGAAKPQPPELFSTLTGVGSYAFLMTLAARLPVNYAGVWAAALALPVVLDARGVMRRSREWLRALLAAEPGGWLARAALALLLFALSVSWFAAIGPESSADGLAMHLAISKDMAAHHVLTFRPDLFVWSVMPMAADFSYTIVHLLGGEAAASLLNFALLAILAALMFQAAREWLRPAPALICAALFASTPLVHLVTGSLFIENFVAALVFAMVMALWRFERSGSLDYLYIAAVCGGTAASAKFGAWAFVLAALVFATLELRRRGWLRPALIAAALLTGFAAPPYLIAWAMAGNPFFPFLNRRFPSWLLEHGIEFRNNAFTQPLTWNAPFDLTFHTDRYLEGLKGAFGFQYLFLIPLGALALAAARSYAARVTAAVALGAGALVMASQPYARYVYPAMPLLAVPLAALASRFAPRQPRTYVALFTAATGCIALNAYFAPSSGWYHKDFYAPAIFRPGGHTRVIHENIPLRDVTIRYREANPASHVLLLVENDLADAGSSAYEYHWHQYRVERRIAMAETAAGLREILRKLDVHDFISRRNGPDDDLLSPPALASFLATCTHPLMENGRFFAARITAECEALDDTGLEAKLEYSPPALVSPGTYDDFDPSMRFRGVWTRSHGFTGPYRHTISYSDATGAEAAFAFEGTALTYVFTKAFNRGIASLSIDGVAHEIDLYAPVPQWQERLEFCCFPPGSHLVVLRATGRKRPEAKDAYIDLDAFIAR